MLTNFTASHEPARLDSNTEVTKSLNALGADMTSKQDSGQVYNKPFDDEEEDSPRHVLFAGLGRLSQIG